MRIADRAFSFFAPSRQSVLSRVFSSVFADSMKRVSSLPLLNRQTDASILPPALFKGVDYLAPIAATQSIITGTWVLHVDASLMLTILPKPPSMYTVYITA
jgi:hypothetical protein